MHQVSGFNKEYYFNNFNSVSFKQADNLAFVRNENKDKPVTKPANPFLSKDTLELSGKKIETALKSFDSGAVNFKDISIGLLESIPFVRRIVSIESGKENNDNFKTLGATLLLLANAPEDTRDLIAGINQFINPKKVKAGLSYEYQSKFSFLRGTLFEFLLKGKGRYTKPISEFLYKKDKTLFDTEIGQKILNLAKCSVEDMQLTQRKDIMKNAVPSFKFFDKPKLRWIIGRASLRITLLSILVFSALEIPQIIKAVKKGNNITSKISNGLKQILKSLVNVSVILLSTALFGAFFAKKGPAGSLFGIGTGAYLGSKVSKKINENIV